MSMHSALHVRAQLKLDRFDLDVDFRTTHRVTGIFGVSGSGKTTLLEIIAGLRRGARGAVMAGETCWLNSEAGVWVPPEGRGIGYVPQDSLLFPHMNVRANLHAGRARAEREGHDFGGTFDSVVRVLDIEALLNRDVRMLSGGERQRVSLARALCSGPRLLLLDEPLAALDAGLRRKVLPFLYRVQKEFALPMIVVSHNPVEVQALCEDLIVLREGCVIARGEPRAVLTRPEVFPLAAGEGYENIVPGVLVETHDEVSTVRLGGNPDGPLLIVSRSVLPIGSPLLLSVPASEIMLALERPRGLSARNIVPARVESVETVGTWRLISARVAPDAPALVAEVTADALAELHCQPGTELFLIVKASSVTLYEDRAAGMA